MLRKLLVAATALALTTGAAHATVFGGDGSSPFATFTDNGPPFPINALSFSAPSVSNFTTSSLSTTGTSSQTVADFFNITETNYFPFLAQDSLTAAFNFNQPGSGNGSVSGTGSVQGIVGNGMITWGTPADVTFSDGSELQISLADTDFTSGIGATFYNAATFTILKDPSPTSPSTPVPEPGSLALLGTGLLGLGLTMRRRRA